MLRVTALVLLASAGVALAQTPEQPCGAPPNTDNEYWFIDQTGQSRSFCVRERRRFTVAGGQTVWAAITGSRYCNSIDRKFQHVTNCNFTGIIRCDRNLNPPAFTIRLRFRHCRDVFGKNIVTGRLPLAKVLEPPGGSVGGAFVGSASGAFVTS
jgi:hypothetical protein